MRRLQQSEKCTASLIKEHYADLIQLVCEGKAGSSPGRARVER
jgi:hypothetical protein